MVDILYAQSSGEVAVPSDDRGLAYGDGLFETIRVTGQRIELADAHCRRMLEGARRLAIPLEPDDLAAALRDVQQRIAAAPAQGTQVVKMLLTRGSGGRGYRPPASAHPRLLVSMAPAPPPPAEGVAVSVSEVPLTVNPVLAGLKTLNRLEQVLASRGIAEGEYEALMLGERGDLREGTRTALMYRWRGQWLTPPRDRVAVASVMLGYVERQLAALDIGLQEDYLMPQQCYEPGFEGLLLLNSVVGAVPVSSLDGQRLPRSDELATIVSLAHQVEE